MSSWNLFLILTTTHENSNYNEEPSKKRKPKQSRNLSCIIRHSKKAWKNPAGCKLGKKRRKRKRRAACVYYNGEKKGSLHQNTKHWIKIHSLSLYMNQMTYSYIYLLFSPAWAAPHRHALDSHWCIAQLDARPSCSAEYHHELCRRKTTAIRSQSSTCRSQDRTVNYSTQVSSLLLCVIAVIGIKYTAELLQEPQKHTYTHGKYPSIWVSCLTQMRKLKS